jgi:hypothetical protein
MSAKLQVLLYLHCETTAVLGRAYPIARFFAVFVIQHQMFSLLWKTIKLILIRQNDFLTFCCCVLNTAHPLEPKEDGWMAMNVIHGYALS